MDRVRNPILPGFNPDPSITVADSVYYLATSSFEYVPGVPIYRSTDLSRWELVGHVATRAEQLGVQDAGAGGGAWAPTLRFRDGVFHVVLTVMGGRGMLHFTATDPAGPWSDGEVLTDETGNEPLAGIDPDLAWGDDGTVYLTYAGLSPTGADGSAGRPSILQARVDLATHRALEAPRAVWSGTGLKFPEAPHLYRVGEWWYLMIAEGGTERGHAISMARGPAPSGPFEGDPANPVLSARSTSRAVQNTGHGDLVVGPDGQWYVVVLGVRPEARTREFSTLGRETFVTRARWRDGWLEIDPVELAPDPPGVWRDDFDGPVLDPGWVGVRRAPGLVGDLRSCPGRLVLTADGSTLDDPRPVFVGRRQPCPYADMRAAVDVSGGRGGLALRYDERFHASIEAASDGVSVRVVFGGLEQRWSAPFEGGETVLSITARAADPGAGDPLAPDIVEFAYGEGAERRVVAAVDGRFLSAEVVGSFAGRVVGVYASRGVVAVDWFEVAGIGA